MGRKKKIKANITTNSIVSGTQLLEYQGNVNFSIARGNKIISTKKYHNAGMPNLFKFLANCIAGNNNSQLRPTQIKLFKYPGAIVANAESPANFVWSTVWENSDPTLAPFAVSPYVLYNTTPVIERKKLTDNDIAENVYYQITFHFRIPYTFIADNTIHMVGFYPNNAADDATDVLAYYLFTTTDKQRWDPLVISGDINNFSIIIDWTISIANKTE